MLFVEIPVDIIRAILEQCDQSSLVSLAQVCSPLEMEVRPILYRSVDLLHRFYDSKRVSFRPEAGFVVLMRLQIPVIAAAVELLANEDPQKFAWHVRIFRFTVDFGANPALRTALSRMINLRHLHFQQTNEYFLFPYLLLVRSDLRVLEWCCYFNDEAAVLAHIHAHYPRLRELHLVCNAMLHPKFSKEKVNINTEPRVPNTFPTLTTLHADWGIAYAIVRHQLEKIEFLDIKINPERDFSPSWFDQPLPLLRYLRIGGLHGKLGLNLLERVVASAPNLEILVIPMKDKNVSDCLHHVISIHSSVTVCPVEAPSASATRDCRPQG